MQSMLIKLSYSKVPDGMVTVMVDWPAKEDGVMTVSRLPEMATWLLVTSIVSEFVPSLMTMLPLPTRMSTLQVMVIVEDVLTPDADCAGEYAVGVQVAPVLRVSPPASIHPVPLYSPTVCTATIFRDTTNTATIFRDTTNTDTELQKLPTKEGLLNQFEDSKVTKEQVQAKSELVWSESTISTTSQYFTKFTSMPTNDNTLNESRNPSKMKHIIMGKKI